MDPWRFRQREVLSKLRGEKRTQEDVAHAAGLRFWRYVNLETGKVELAAREVPLLARAFNVSPDELAGQLGVLDPPYNPRQAMEDAGTFTAARMDQIEREVDGKHPAAQKARIDAETRLGVDPHAEMTERARERRRRIG